MSGRTGLHGGGSGGGEAVRTQAVAQQPCLAHGHHGVAGMQALVQKASLKEIGEEEQQQFQNLIRLYINKGMVQAHM